MHSNSNYCVIFGPMLVLAFMMISFLPLNVSAIPPDQKVAVLTTWSLPTYSNGTTDIVSDFAGNLYFTEAGANKIGRLESVPNTITEWTLPITNGGQSSGPTSIAFDPSTGSIFYAVTGANKIGLLVPATNMITEWTLPTTNGTTPSPTTNGTTPSPTTNGGQSSGPTSIAFDPTTGSIFYAVTGANKIGLLVPATNTITEWTLPKKSDSNGFKDIVFDGVESIYFVGNNGNTIGKLGTSDNMFVEWSLPDKTANVTSLAFLFDGGVYFSEAGANKIGRLYSDTNTFTEWTLPTTNGGQSSGPTSIASDPSTGSIYFSKPDANKIGRLVPPINAITEWILDNKPLAITSTPGGSIYFIDELGRIGRMG